MFAIEHKHKGNLIDCVIFEQFLVTAAQDVLSRVYSDRFERVEEIVHRDRLNAKHIVRVKNGLKVVFGEELLLKFIYMFIVRVLFFKVLPLQALKRLQNVCHGVFWLFMEDVGQKFLKMAKKGED